MISIQCLSRLSLAFTVLGKLKEKRCGKRCKNLVLDSFGKVREITEWRIAWIKNKQRFWRRLWEPSDDDNCDDTDTSKLDHCSTSQSLSKYCRTARHEKENFLLRLSSSHYSTSPITSWRESGIKHDEIINGLMGINRLTVREREKNLILSFAFITESMIMVEV